MKIVCDIRKIQNVLRLADSLRGNDWKFPCFLCLMLLHCVFFLLTFMLITCKSNFIFMIKFERTVRFFHSWFHTISCWFFRHFINCLLALKNLLFRHKHKNCWFYFSLCFDIASIVKYYHGLQNGSHWRIEIVKEL